MIRSAERIAVLSDVHGVLPLLEAVLEEPAVRASDLIVVTGDHAAGPQPREVLDRLVGLGDRAMLIRGNADRELCELARNPRADLDVPPIDRWAAGQLSVEQVAVLESLPMTATVDVAGFGEVMFCHATPRQDAEIVLVDSSLQRWRDVLADVPDSVRMLVCGHTHMPFVRLLDRRWVVNPGSIGMPYGSPLAPWALVEERGVSIHWAEVDRERVAAHVLSGSAYTGVRDWVHDYLQDPPADGDALDVFGSLDGRSSPTAG